MPKRFLQRVVVQPGVLEDGVTVADLATHPLSVVFLNLSGLLSVARRGALTWELASCLRRISVIHNGVRVVSLSGVDAIATAFHRHGVRFPVNSKGDNVAGARRNCVIPIFLGEAAWDIASAFPKSGRGELVLEVEVVREELFSSLDLSVESLELPSAKPSEFVRASSFSGSTRGGINQLELPVGQTLLGVLFWLEDVDLSSSDGSRSLTADSFRLLVDNEAFGLAGSSYEVFHGLSSLWGRSDPPFRHGHSSAAASPSVEFTDNHGPSWYLDRWQHYSFLDLDPTRDREFSPVLSSVCRAQIEFDSPVADSNWRMVTFESSSAKGVGGSCGCD